MSIAIEQDGLTKSVGDVLAIDGVSAVAHPGQVTALLQPNGMSRLARRGAGDAGCPGEPPLRSCSSVRHTASTTCFSLPPWVASSSPDTQPRRPPSPWS